MYAKTESLSTNTHFNGSKIGVTDTNIATSKERRIVFRVVVYSLLVAEAPTVVVIDEAVELAKTDGDHCIR